MKKLLLLILPLMLSFNSYGEWSYIGEDDNGESSYYIDLETLRKIDGYVYYWNLVDFDMPDEFGNMSGVTYAQGDCGITRAKILTAVSYKKPMGEEVDDTYTEPNPEWEYMTPYTVGEFLLNTSCRLVDASYEKQLEIIEELLYGEEESKEILESLLLIDEAMEQKEQDQKNQDLLELEIAELKLEQEKIQYNRMLAQAIQDEQDTTRSIIIEDQLNRLKSAYVIQIASKVKALWRYQAAEEDWSAEVYVVQDKEGNVKAVDVRNVNVGDSSLGKSFMDSIERAVYKSSPLPAAPDDAVFDREIYMLFSVN